MIAAMQKLTVFALKEDREALFRQLMLARCLQLRDLEEDEASGEISRLARRETGSLYESEQRLARYGAAISLLSPLGEKPKLFSPKPERSLAELFAHPLEEADSAAAKAEELNDQLIARRQTAGYLQSYLTALAPWQQDDLPLNCDSTASCRIFRMSLTLPEGPEPFRQQLADKVPLAEAQLVHREGSLCFFTFFCHTSQLQACYAFLRGWENNPAHLPEEPLSAAGCRAAYEKKLSEENARLRQCEEALAQLAASSLGQLKLGYDALWARLQCARAQNGLYGTEYAFFFTGFVPKDDGEKIRRVLESFRCCYELEDADGEDTPVLLKNGRLSRPFDILTEMYSTPAPGSLDPTPFMAPFFALFFGMMFADAGYGLIMLAAALFALKKLQLSAYLKKACVIVLWCGASTAVWGLIYGGFFGDVITVVSREFFGHEIVMPKLIDPLNEPITILVISFALGALHIFLGMGLQAYLMIRRGHLLDALFDVGLWYLLLIGLPMLLLPGLGGKIGLALSLIGAIGLVLTQGRREKGILKKAGKGILSLYNVTSYLSDVLSYSRILALGMASGVIANVVNLMGALPGGNAVGFVVFLAVFLVGTALNFFINILGSYVHSSRLQYVEFFGKFFEGGGSPFEPLAARTKYTYLVHEKEDL